MCVVQMHEVDLSDYFDYFLENIDIEINFIDDSVCFKIDTVIHNIPHYPYSCIVKDNKPVVDNKIKEMIDVYKEFLTDKLNDSVLPTTLYFSPADKFLYAVKKAKPLYCFTYKEKGSDFITIDFESNFLFV